MYFDLQDAGNSRELALWQEQPHLPGALHALVAHAGSSWDSPLVGAAVGDAVIPGPDAVDLRTLPSPDAGPGAAGAGGDTAAARPAATEPEAVGSNNFAVAGTLTAHGAAIVADDMHLALRAPGIWFRARMRYPD